MLAYNGNAWKGIVETLLECRPVVAFVQEHKLRTGPQYADATAFACKKVGMKLLGGLAVAGDMGGASGGVGVLVRADLQVKKLDLRGITGTGQDTFDIVPGHAAGCLWKVPHGRVVVLISVYLHPGLETSGHNWQILLRVGEVLAWYGLPFVIGGDFNMTAWYLTRFGLPLLWLCVCVCVCVFSRAHAECHR